jgi:stage IV sporulation protein B
MFPFSVNAKKEEKNVKTAMYDKDSSKSYVANLTFLNIIPIKTVQVNVVPKCSVAPCGTPFGVKIHTEGVMVIGVSEVSTNTGNKSPAKISGLQKGDVISKVDSQTISNNDDLEKIIENSNGKEVRLSVFRNDTGLELNLTPLKSVGDNKYRAGIWVRDSSAGIGTLTFCNNESKVFGGLGHGICDVDTGEILPLAQGDIVDAAISDVSKGYEGSPGELKGCFIDSEPIGKIYSNSDTGIYGVLDNQPPNTEQMDVAMKQQVKKGPAKILTTIEGTKPQYYDINIDSVSYNLNSPTKNIRISVTDEDLLKKTGGIVQGMSGSPIIQDGLLAGAVTHVFVNNPSKGYGIFAETMLTNSNNILDCKYKKAS